MTLRLMKLIYISPNRELDKSVLMNQTIFYNLLNVHISYTMRCIMV